MRSGVTRQGGLCHAREIPECSALAVSFENYLNDIEFPLSSPLLYNFGIYYPISEMNKGMWKNLVAGAKIIPRVVFDNFPFE